MDVAKAASSLRDQMIVFDVAHKQIEVLDELISALSRQSIVSSLDGNAARCLHFSLRLSVSEGVKQMYQQASEKKWNQIQTTARSIMSELQDTEQTPSMSSPPPPDVSTSTDKSASTWSSSLCEFYRSS